MITVYINNVHCDQITHISCVVMDLNTHKHPQSMVGFMMMMMFREDASMGSKDPAKNS